MAERIDHKEAMEKAEELVRNLTKEGREILLNALLNFNGRQVWKEGE